MSLFVRKEEVLEKILRHDQSVVHFVNDESNQFWYVSLCKYDVPFYTGILTEEEGRNLLLQFCLCKRSFSLNQNLDTIEVVSLDRELGYIRFLKNDHIVVKRHNLVEDFLYQMLSGLEKTTKHVYIKNCITNSNGSRLIFESDKFGEGFSVESNSFESDRLYYLLKKYLEDHPYIKAKETDDYYLFETVTFDKNGVRSSSHEELSHLLSNHQSMSSSLLYEIYCSIHENRRNSLIREKK